MAINKFCCIFLLGVALMGCQTYKHSIFPKSKHRTDKNGSSYTMWEGPNQIEKDSAYVELWVVNIEGVRIPESQELIIHTATGTKSLQKGYRGYDLYLAPGKYTFEAIIKDAPHGSIKTKKIKLKAQSRYRIVMLYVEDWNVKRLLK